ncbi:MAG: rhomboid family intramembrane serine protease, partial [Gemmatimonadota bacterium]
GVPVLDPTSLDLIHWGASFGPLTIGFEWWRLLTSTFLHVGLLHIALNMWCLLSLGLLSESYFGSASFVLGYLICGLAGALLSLALHPNRVGAGASGAIFGVAGRTYVATLMARRRNPSLGIAAPRQLGSFLIINLVLGQTIPIIDNSAHVGGMLAGALIGLADPMPARPGADRRRHLAALGTVGALAIAAGAFALGLTRAVSVDERQQVLEQIQQEERMVPSTDPRRP